MSCKGFPDLWLQTTESLFLDIVRCCELQKSSAATFRWLDAKTFPPEFRQLVSIKLCDTSNGFCNLSLKG